MDDDLTRMIENLPNSNVEQILGCVEAGMRKAHAANIPRSELTDRFNAAYGREPEHANAGGTLRSER